MINLVSPFSLSPSLSPPLFQSTATIYCPYDGVVKELMYEVDDIAKKDEPLVTIEVSGEGEETSTSSTTQGTQNII